MEKRLYGIITTPGMLVTVAMAIGILWQEPYVLKEWWLHIKLTFVVILLGYHFYCRRLMKQLERGDCAWSSKQLRALNEFPTLLLVVIVLLAIFQNNFPTNATSYLVVGLVVVMAATIQLYARKRRLDNERKAQEATPASTDQLLQS